MIMLLITTMSDINMQFPAGMILKAIERSSRDSTQVWNRLSSRFMMDFTMQMF